MSALVYAGISGYLYYDVYVNIDRKEDLKRYLLNNKSDGYNKPEIKRNNFNLSKELAALASKWFKNDIE